MKIQNKLFAVFIIFGALLVLSLVAVMQWSIGKGMVAYVNQKEINSLTPVIEQLTKHYQRFGNWQDYYHAQRKFERQIRQSLQGTEFSINEPPARRPPPRGERNFSAHDQAKRDKANDSFFQPPKRGRESHRPPPVREHPVSYALLDENKSYIVGHYPPEKNYTYQPIMVAGAEVGFFAVSKRDRLTQGYEFDFVEQQTHYLWLIALGLFTLVLLIILPFARHLVAPIKQLTQGMHWLTQGKYQSKLSTQRQDEFADLARDFNELAQTLEANDSARKRWLANISHELRTPVAILKGELEAIIDGVRPLSLTQIQSAHQEVGHLQHLIDDLHALTSADIGGMSYKKQLIDLVEFLENELVKLRSYLAHSGFEFAFINRLDKQSVKLFADPVRLCQLFENLVNNCVKYCQTGNYVSLTVSMENEQVLLVLADNGVGVDEQHLEHLFEHLYRVEHSRNRQTGGSGLGLSICAHIVSAHQGHIAAQASSLGGLAIHISLPVTN